MKRNGGFRLFGVTGNYSGNLLEIERVLGELRAGNSFVQSWYFGVTMPLISEYWCHINKTVIQG